MLSLSIKSNLESLRRALSHLDEEMERELRHANQRIGVKVNADAKKTLQIDVYDVPTPNIKGGKKQWRRTGNLKRQESWQVSSDGLSVRFVNSAPYASFRAKLGTPGYPRRAGIQRPQTDKPPAQRSKTLPIGRWQEVAALMNVEFTRSEYNDAIQRALRSVARAH